MRENRDDERVLYYVDISGGGNINKPRIVQRDFQFRTSVFRRLSSVEDDPDPPAEQELVAFVRTRQLQIWEISRSA